MLAETVAENRRWLTPPQIAKELGVSADKVHVWIRSGELHAIDVSTRRGGRPRWRIAPVDLEVFLAARRAVPQSKVVRRKRTPANVIEYF